MDQEASGFNTKQTVAIVGLGLIGGSYARGLRRIGVGHIIAIDPDEKALHQAKQEGIEAGGSGHLLYGRRCDDTVPGRE